jgi:hypothetical protein
MDKYGHKIVLVCPAAHWFRGGDLNFALTKLTEFNLQDKNPGWSKIKTQADLDYCFALYKTLFGMQDFDLRIESPFLSFYTNTPKDIDKLSKIDEGRVKYISVPPAVPLDKGTVIMVREGYDYKVTLGRTRQSHENFIEWAEKTPAVKLTGSAKKELRRMTSWGGSHFYVKDDKALTMTRMFLGGGIGRIDRIVKANAAEK